MQTKTTTADIVEASPIATSIGTLYASMSDTAGGEPISKGRIIMGHNAGTVKTTHNGKDYTVNIVHDIGASLVMECNGRNFRLNLEAFLEEGIKVGLLNPAPMDFPKL